VPGAAEVSFVREIAPILAKNCLACHGAQEPKGDFQLQTFELLGRPGSSEAAPVTAGDPDDSELLRLISSDDETERMPKDADPLSTEQVALVRRWIEQGAKFDGPDPKAPLSSLLPKEPHPAPPEAYTVAVPITALAFHPEGRELAAGGYHEITLWHPADGRLLRRIPNVAQRTYGLAYSPDGKLLAAASGNPGQLGEVKLFRPETGELVHDLATLPDVAFDVAFSPAGDKLAAGGADRSVRIFDVATGKQERLIEDHADWVMAVAYSADGTKLGTASRDKTSKVFDAAKGESLVTYPGYGDQAYGIAFSPDGKQAYTSGRARSIHVWNLENGERAHEIGGFGHEVYKLRRVGDRLYAASADKTARRYKLDDRSQEQTYQGHGEWIYSLAVCEATSRLATGSFDGEVRIWNTADGGEVGRFRAAPGLGAK
jgi:WD40 repeat protein